ncbi:MAG: amino acid adenylation domain-containing protein, partial [bacterium]|nr:amino acid adenylation domain-containing protein [bacterium]
MLPSLETLLRSIARDPEQCLSELPLLSAAQRHQLLVEWNDTEWRCETSAGSSAMIFQHLFEARARLTPDAPALIDPAGDETLTYWELNRRANQLAHSLRHHGVGPEVRVGLLLERSVDMVVAILAILKAGGAYVPLDPGYPRERLEYMLEDAGVGVVVTHERLSIGLPHRRAGAPSELELVTLDSEHRLIAGECAADPDCRALPESAAYVIYTSGSTGRPKGVLVGQRSLACYVLATIEHYAIVPGERVLQLSSISFDNSVGEIFPCLVAGATVVLRDERATGSVPELLEHCREQSITVLFPPTALWHELAAEAERIPPSLRLVCFGG